MEAILSKATWGARHPILLQNSQKNFLPLVPLLSQFQEDLNTQCGYGVQKRGSSVR